MKKIFLFFLLIIMAGCMQKVDKEKEITSLLSTDTEFSDFALENGVGAAFVEYADTNAVMLPAGGSPVKGIEQVKAGFEGYKSILQWKPEFADVSASGDLGYTWGKYVSTSKDADGNFHKSYGKYLSVWKKQTDGRWRWVLDIGNSNPAPESEFESDRVKFDPAANAAEDIQAAIIEAKNSGKKILLDVGGEWCIWCHKMDIFIKRHQKLNEIIEDKFVVVKINYSKENKNEEVLSRFPEVGGYPHIFILDENGKLIHSQNTAELEKNKAYDLDKFLEFVNKF